MGGTRTVSLHKAKVKGASRRGHPVALQPACVGLQWGDRGLSTSRYTYTTGAFAGS